MNRVIAMTRALALLIVVGLALNACAATPTFSAQTASYQVKLTLDALRMGERQATIDITDHQGQPVSIQKVRLLPLMRQHGMVSPEAFATRQPDGTYQTDQILFSMEGDWQIEMMIEGDQGSETATIELAIGP